LQQSSLLERYLKMPDGPEYNGLTYIEYFSRYRPTIGSYGEADHCV
jgi:hypothetical protein